MNEDYKSETCRIKADSEITPEEAESLIGKKVARISVVKYETTVYFNDGTYLNVSCESFDGRTPQCNFDTIMGAE